MSAKWTGSGHCHNPQKSVINSVHICYINNLFLCKVFTYPHKTVICLNGHSCKAWIRSKTIHIIKAGSKTSFNLFDYCIEEKLW